MKKKIFLTIRFVVLLLIVILLLVNILNKDSDSDSNLKKVTVAEVAHSIFYAPQYLADSLGFFEDEGVDVEITLANGADAVTAAVLSEDVDIGFCGTEATIYVVNKKRKLFYILSFLFI